MVLSQKERSLLEDLKGAEQLCIIKYTKYAEEACDPCLAELFNSIKAVEAGHLATVTRILAGDSVTAETPKSATEETFTCTPSVCSAEANRPMMGLRNSRIVMQISYYMIFLLLLLTIQRLCVTTMKNLTLK